MLRWILLMLTLTGCASGQSYQEQVLNRPKPETQAGIEKECAAIRSEIVRMQALAEASGNSNQSLRYRAMAANNIATLESRAANLGCRSAFSDSGQYGDNEIQQCITACLENTSRTSEQCFDSCNR